MGRKVTCFLCLSPVYNINHSFPTQETPHHYSNFGVAPPPNRARMFEYKHLTLEEREHFVAHGWLRVPGAIKPEYLEEWMKNVWVRLGWDENDKSTWEEEYIKLPRHREVPAAEFCPEAWEKVGASYRLGIQS